MIQNGKKFAAILASMAMLALLTGCGGGYFSESATPAIPDAPTGLTATAGNAQVSLSWSASSGATSYRLYYSTSSGVTPATGTKIDGITGTSYTHTGLTNGTTYYYVVTAVDTGGESGASNQAAATPVAGIASAPLNLTATAGNAQVALTWSASTGAVTYNLYWSTTPGVTPANGTKIGGITAASYTQTGLTNGTTYYYVVTAVNTGGESSASNKATATPVAAIASAPLNLKATAGNAQVALAWSASTGAVTYNLYWSTTSGVTPVNGTKIGGITGTSYTQTGLTNGTTYYYVVTAVNTGGESSASNQASATPKVVPATVVGSVLVNGVPRSMALYQNGSQLLFYVCSDSQINIVDATDPSKPIVLSTFANSLLTENGKATGFEGVSCAIDGTYLIVGYSREDENTSSSPTAIPTYFTTFSLVNPLSPTQVASSATIDRPDSNGLFVQGKSALMFQSTSFYDQYSGFIDQETGDVWAADLTNATTTGSFDFLSDVYPCGGINSSTSACNDGVNVPTATYSGTVCTDNGTFFIPNDQYEGGPFRLFPGAIVNNTTAYFASTSANLANIEEPACPSIAGELLVIDTSTPSALTITTSVPVPQATFLTGVSVQGNTALVVGDSEGIYSIDSGFVGTLVIASFDISDPQNPTLLDSIVTQLTDQPGATVVPLGDNNFAIGGTSNSGTPSLVQVDATNPASLTYTIYSSPVVASPEIGQPPYVYALSSIPSSTVNQFSILQFVP